MNRLKLFLFFCLLAPSILFAQKGTDFPLAFKTGNAGEIAKNFTQSTDLVVLGEDEIVNPEEGRTKLNFFFSNHEPLTFKILHTGESNNGMRYSIGILETKNGNFRISYYVKDIKGKPRIQQLTIDAE